MQSFLMDKVQSASLSSCPQAQLRQYRIHRTQLMQCRVQAGAGADAPAPPAPSSARAKLEALRQVEQQYQAALQRQQQLGSGSIAAGTMTTAMASPMVDKRMYDQLAASRQRISQKLSETNLYIKYLEGRVEKGDEGMVKADETLELMSTELGNTRRLGESVSAALLYGVDKAEALQRLARLMERLDLLQKGLLEQRAKLGKSLVRRVPVTWMGVASEVKLMGTFDGWTRGCDLSAEDVTTDSVFSCYSAELLLLPGTYRVKLLVDGDWRLASCWPTEPDEEGNTVNVLTVE